MYGLTTWGSLIHIAIVFVVNFKVCLLIPLYLCLIFFTCLYLIRICVHMSVPY